MTGNVLLQVQPQFPGQDPGVSAVQPRHVDDRAPTWARPQLPQQFCQSGALTTAKDSGTSWTPLCTPASPPVPSPQVPATSSVSRSVVQAVLRGLCSSVPRERESWVGGGEGSKVYLIASLSRGLSPAHPFPHHLKMGCLICFLQVVYSGRGSLVPASLLQQKSLSDLPESLHLRENR